MEEGEAAFLFSLTVRSFGPRSVGLLVLAGLLFVEERTCVLRDASGREVAAALLSGHLYPDGTLTFYLLAALPLGCFVAFTYGCVWS